MAYTYEQTEEEKKKQAEGGAVPASPQGAGTLLGGGAGTPTQTQPKPSTSGWTNLRSYLDVNAPQSMDLAGKMSTNIIGTGEAAKQSLEGLRSGYQSRLGAASPGDYQSANAQASANPVEFAKNQANVEQFKKLREGLFQAPGLVQEQPEYAGAVTKIGEASKLKETAQTPGGQQELLRALSPTQTQGQYNLNQLLLGANPAAREKLRTAGAPYEGLRSSLEQSVAEQNAAREKTIADIAGAKESVKKQFVEPQTATAKKLQDEINKRVETAALDFNKNQTIQNLQNFLQKKPNTLTTADLEKFGIKTPQNIIPFGDTWFSVDGGAPTKTVTDVIGPGGELKKARTVINPLDAILRQYGTISPEALPNYFSGLRTSSGNASKQTVAAPGEVEKMLALQQLIGEGLSPYFSPEDLSTAGSYIPAEYGTSRFTFK